MVHLAPSGSDICRGPDGNVWFTQPQFRFLGRMNATGNTTVFELPGPAAVGLAAGDDGYLWCSFPIANSIGRIDITRLNSIGLIDATVLREFPLPSGGPGITNSNVPLVLTNGPDGRMWFTEVGAGKIGNISRDGATINEYTVPGSSMALAALGDSSLPASNPLGIAVGADRHLWFTMPFRDRIGRVATDGSFYVPNPARDPIGGLALPPGSRPAYICLGLWFTEMRSHKIGHIAVHPPAQAGGSFSFSVEEIPLPVGAIYPSAITIGARVWFGVEGKIGYLSADRRVTLIEVPPVSSGPMTEPERFGQCTGMVSQQFVAGGSGELLWFADPNRYRIGRIDLEESASSPVVI